MTANKKYPCPDCKMCQWCDNARCHLCLGPKLKAKYDARAGARLKKQTSKRKKACAKKTTPAGTAKTQKAVKS